MVHEETSPDTRFGYSIREACVATSLSRSTIYNLIGEGRLEAIKIGARRIITGASVRRLMDIGL